MIVCVCNRINERGVREAAAAGARSVGRVYRHHGRKVCCGRCLDCMHECLSAAVSEIDLASASPVATAAS